MKIKEYINKKINEEIKKRLNEQDENLITDSNVDREIKAKLGNKEYKKLFNAIQYLNDQAPEKVIDKILDDEELQSYFPINYIEDFIEYMNEYLKYFSKKDNNVNIIKSILNKLK